MPIRISCPKCQTKYEFAENFLGAKARCRKCQFIILLQAAKPKQDSNPSSFAPTMKEEIPSVIPATPPSKINDSAPTRTSSAAAPPAAPLFEPPRDAPSHRPLRIRPVASAVKKAAPSINDSSGFNIADVPESELYPPTPELEEILEKPNVDSYKQSTGTAFLYFILTIIVAAVLSVVGVVVVLFFVIWGATILLFAALFLLAIPFQFLGLFDRKPKLVLAEDGFFDHTIDKNHYIPWLRVATMEFLQGDMILTLVDAQGQEWDREISLHGLEEKPDKIARKMQQRLELARGRFVDNSRNDKE